MLKFEYNQARNIIYKQVQTIVNRRLRVCGPDAPEIIYSSCLYNLVRQCKQRPLKHVISEQKLLFEYKSIVVLKWLKTTLVKFPKNIVLYFCNKKQLPSC